MASKKDKPVIIGPSAAAKMLLEAGQKQFGAACVYSLGEHRSRHIVIPAPSLAFRWLIRSNGWQLGAITCSAGQPKCGKSLFSFEVLRWFLIHKYPGIGSVIDTESKMSPDLCYSVVGFEYAPGGEKEGLVTIYRADNIQKWQEMAMSRITFMNDVLRQQGSKPHFPMFTIVDSIGGTTSESMQDGVEDKGHAPGKTIGPDAQMNTQYLRSVHPFLLGFPAGMHLVNQEKDGIGVIKSKYTPGGIAPGFHTSLDIRQSRGSAANRVETGGEDSEGSKPDFKGVGPDGLKFEGIYSKMKTKFNSNGSTVEREIVVPISWKMVPISDEERGRLGGGRDKGGQDMFRQKTTFDWATPTTRLILRFAGDLEGVLGFVKPTRGDSKMVDTEKWGTIGFAELGDKVNGDPALLDACTAALGIPLFSEFEPGIMDYEGDLDRLEKNEKEAAARKKKAEEDKKK